MPRGKSYRRSQAAKRRVERQESWTTSLDGNRVDGVPLVGGTGWRHKVLRWEESQLTNKQHKLVIPAACANKKPEAVIVLAPSNNLTAGRGLENSSADFAALLKTARSRWSNVVVLDFPPRLSVEEDQQKLLRMAYHSVCADQGVPYHHICENFPLHQRDLWARDGTHLSDSAGMPILAYLLWQAADRQLAEPEPEPHVAPIPTCPYRPRFATQVVVKGIEPQPRPAANPDGWITVVNGQKRSLPEAQLAALDKQVSQKKVELRECFIPLTPVRFSPATLRAIEKTSPSFLPTPEEGTCSCKQKVAVKRRTVVAKRRLPKEQVDTVVSAVEVSRVAKPPTAVPVVDKVDTTMSDVEVFSVVTPTSAVSTPAVDEDEATLHAVDLTSEPVAVTVHVGDQLQPPHPATPGSIELQPAQPAISIELQAAHPATPGSIELQPAQPAISIELQAAHPATPGSIKLRQGPGGNKCAQREAAKEGNRDAKDSLKHLGSVYLHNRDVCAQEAVYRLTNMRLKECSRKVVFVPVGEKTVRMSLPLKVLQRKALSHDLSADDMWMTNIVDRYRSRPVAVDFRDMCLASFASQYRVLSKNENSC
ncbi:hypothetical protein D5F01_LYC24516 [Larimichthys crocea]|uniref:Uncharacterized protein n=1 Tax=Larimichthys crocea TaxID=215358 RepID=A0A6G0HE71_LARCR|nr:hypothetical protein D5F01_LYC24516 [Larimichthys crocea]